MKHNFTHNNLLQFLYRETTASEAFAIRNAINSDWQLKEDYTELLEAKRELPKVTFSPSSSVIDNILRYSNATAVEPQH